MKKVLFIAAINKGNIPIGGQEAKNQFMYEYLLVNTKLTAIDTKNWKRRPWLIFIIIFHLFKFNDIILLHLATLSALKILRIINFFGKHRLTYFMIVGNWFPKFIESQKGYFPLLNSLKGISIEGKKSQEFIYKLGLKNIKYHPHFKKIPQVNYPFRSNRQNEFKFVFISRIDKDKGAHIAIEAFKSICEKYPHLKLSLDFYGKVKDTFEADFNKYLAEVKGLSYKGLIDLSKRENYQKLVDESYYCLLFPSTYIGEGFPGSLIDAMIIGAPIIASDWNLNSEVVLDGFNGVIVPLEHLENFSDYMEYALLNPDLINKMSDNQKKQSSLFDTQIIFPDVLKEAGL